VIQGKKIAVVLPAYNAEKTQEKTWEALGKTVIDDTILVDDCSRDRTGGRKRARKPRPGF